MLAKPQSVKDGLADNRVRADITDGGFQPGARLPAYLERKLTYYAAKR